jgi:hypothetical protein
MMDEGRLVTGQQLQQVVQGYEKTIKDLAQKVDDLNFWTTIPGHPDAMVKGASKEFKDWMAKQPKAIQKLGKSIKTQEDVRDLFDMYVEDMAAHNAKAYDAKQRDALKAEQDLHGHSVRQRKQATRGEGKDGYSAADLDDLWSKEE